MAPGSPKNKTNVLLIVLVACLCLVIGYKAFSTRQQTFHQERPITEYSTDTKRLYYYLLYTDGILSDDFPLAKEGLEGLVDADPSEALFTEAILFFLSQQAFDDAVVFAEKAVKHHPDSQNLLVFLAEAYSQTNNTDKAIALLENSYRRDMASDFMIEELIGLYLRTQQTDKANKLLTTIPESKASPATIFYQSKLYSQQGKFGKARAVLRSFTARYPDVADAWVELGAVEEKLKNFTASIEAYKRACQLNPYNEEIWLHLAELQLQLRNVAGAFNTLQQHPNLAEYGFNGAILLSNHGYQSEAKVLINDSIARGANADEGAVLMAAIAVRTSEDYKEALTFLNSVNKDSQYYSLAQERKAQLLAHLDQCDEAREIIDNLRDNDISTIEIWGIEAYCFVKEDKFDKALQSINKALIEFPDNPDILFSKGSIYDTMGKKKEAFAIMETLLTLSPDDPRVMNYIGYTLAEEDRDLDRALALVQAAHEAMPEAEYITDSLAWVHYKLKNYDVAWEYINQCLSLADEDPVIWEHYADIARQRNDLENAAKGYANALAKDSKNKDVIARKLDAVTKELKQASPPDTSKK